MKRSKKYGVYKGQFVAGKKEGRGTIKITTSKKLRLTAPKSPMVTYEGEWKANYCHGQGRITYIDGSVYKGNFVENRKVGNGKMQSTPTDKFLAEYDGDWKGDAEDGQGFLLMSWQVISTVGRGLRSYDFIPSLSCVNWGML